MRLKAFYAFYAMIILWTSVPSPLPSQLRYLLSVWLPPALLGHLNSNFVIEFKDVQEAKGRTKG